MGHVLTQSERRLHSRAVRNTSTFLVNTDPRVRILAAGAFAIAVVACNWIGALLLALSFSIVTMLAMGLAPKQTLKRMIAMDGFIVFILVLLPFTVQGDPLFSVFGLEASQQGLRQAVTIALKANAVVLMLMVLVGTMEAVTLGHALHAMRVPSTLVHLLLFTVRYIEVLYEEYGRLRIAMKARGFRSTNRLHTYRSFGYLVGMMLVRALERSERILQAMKCRGFTGVIPILSTMRLRRADLGFLLAMALAIASIVSLDLANAMF